MQFVFGRRAFNVRYSLDMTIQTFPLPRRMGDDNDRDNGGDNGNGVGVATKTRTKTKKPTPYK